MPVNNAIQGPAARRSLFQKPQVNLARSSSSRMWLVSLCAGLAILQSSLTDSFASLFVALTAVIGAILTELLFDDMVMRRSLSQGSHPRASASVMSRDGSAVASALVLALLLPNHIHPLFAFLGAVFAMVVIKHSFGGLGTNWVNPALGAWLFIRFGWPRAFDNALQGSALGVPVASLGELFLPPRDSFWTSLLNKTIFALTASDLPQGYTDLLAYSGPGIIADRGVLALLLGTIVLLAGQASRFWAPLAYLGTYCVLVRLFGALPFGGGFAQGDMVFGLFSGGVLVAAFILAADPSTGPKSRIAALVFAALGGVLSFVFRYLGAAPYGAFFAVALLNALAPLCRYIENRFLYEAISGAGESGTSGEAPCGTSSEASRGGTHAEA